MTDIYKNFSGKTVFFSGVTGFVGKVFLWKLLKEFPDLEGAICLIRTKKGQNPQQRLKESVLSSPCFEPLKKQIGEEEWNRRASKVIAVSGDMMEDRLGLSDADYSMVAAKTHFIVHMAATVNFDERLDVSVKMNVLGSMRMMSLAHKAPKLEAYVHMSTCYVNYQRNHRQVVRETVYPLPFDAEEMCKFILAQDPKVMQLVTNRLFAQYGFPNTYTLTKSMAEQVLERRKGSLPLTIIRPAIVGCAWREPMPGWVDALTAAGGIFLTAGLGIMRELHCKGSNVADLVPVDYVVNSTIKLLHRTGTFYQARKNDKLLRAPVTTSSGSGVAVPVKGGRGSGVVLASPALAGKTAAPAATSAAVNDSSSTGTMDAVSPTLPFVYQASTSSSLNLMRWETAAVAVHDYWNAHPHPSRVSKCDMTLVDNYLAYRFRFITRRVIPVAAMKVAVSVPFLASPSQKKLVTRLERAVFRSADLQRQFAPFMNNEWCFDASNTNSLDESLLPEHQKAFSCDVYDINWHAYTIAYSYGMIKYIMKTNDGRSAPLLPPSGSEEFIKASL